jgi:MerR family mercuric resistance operon transcriptional regulator
MLNDSALTIGQLAKSANVNVETIRYYQKKGLLTKPRKPKTGYRKYTTDFVSRVCFIKRAQQLGFTLNQIHELLDLGNGRCKEVQALAEDKLLEIEQRLNDLRTMRRSLSDLVMQCSNGSKDVHCALITSLTKNRR